MIKNYKNSDQLLNSTMGSQGLWLSSEDSELLKLNTVTSSIDITSVSPVSIELHVYDLSGGYLGGNHLIDEWKFSNGNEGIELNIHKNIRDLGFKRGNSIAYLSFQVNLIACT